MMLYSISIGVGIALLVWGADRFVDGAADTARHVGISPLIIGMVIVGFGTSAPEMLVSVLSAWQNNPGIAIGNAYGSNIANIALILGATATIRPINVRSNVLRKELPILTIVTGIAVLLIGDAGLSRVDALLLLTLFGALMAWIVWQGRREPVDTLGQEVEHKLADRVQPLGRAILWLIIGLGVLILSSRILVWGASSMALKLGISDLIVGLTIVAVGTSLPEFASSVIAARKGEHDIALGNVLGSNLFNTLAVVGLAGIVRPMSVAPETLRRDIPVMVGLTLSLFVFGFGLRGQQGRINRFEGLLLISAYIGYTAVLIVGSLGR